MRSQSQIVVSDEEVESYQLQSRQLELPVAPVQDSIADFESVDLEPISQHISSTSPTFGTGLSPYELTVS
jgi:hypothetical protein